jgi:hypothetical protein
MKTISKLRPAGTGTDACRSLFRIDRNIAQGRQVDDHPVIADSIAGHIVTAAPHGHRQIVLSGKLHGPHHILLSD